MKETVKISFVVTARNDDHGGGFLNRLRIFVNGIVRQSNKHKLKAELIIVDWNTPSDKSRLSQVISIPEDNKFCIVRFIEVPFEIHSRFKYAHKLPLYQMIGKNVGIRRAMGEFVLATCADLLFSDELFEFLASGDLEERCLYRADRYDVPEDVPPDASIDEQLEFCEQNITRVNYRHGTLNLMTGRYFPTYIGFYTDSTRLHFNACGDFTLMSKNDWCGLKGYPEFDMYSAHIDSLMLLMAYHAGIKQEILSPQMRIYHIEHSSSMIAEKATKLFNDLKASGIPEIKVSQLERWAYEMNRSKQPVTFNSQGWGFASEQLKDTIFAPEPKWIQIESGNHAEKRLLQSVRQVKPFAGKSILIIADHPPRYDTCHEDNRLYQWIRILAKHHKITLLVQVMIEEGKYIEVMREAGVCVIYDIEILKEQILKGIHKTLQQYASGVNMEMLFKDSDFDVVMLDSPKISKIYMHYIRELSSKSVVMINAFKEYDEQADKSRMVYACEQADVVLSSVKNAEFISSMLPDLDIKVLPEPHSSDFSEDGLLNIFNTPFQPADKNLKRFCISPASIPDDICSNESEVMVIFVVKDIPEIARLSLQALFNNTDPARAKIVIGIDSKMDNGVSKKLEREFRYYFRYDNEQELMRFISRIAGRCRGDYLAVMDSSIVVPPCWEKGLIRYLRQDTEVGIVTPVASDSSYSSMYEFEQEAWMHHDKHKGDNIVTREVEVPCAVFKLSLMKDYADIKNLLDLITRINNKGFKMLRARDTFIWHLKSGIKNKKQIICRNSEKKILSVIIPSCNNLAGLRKCLESIFSQKGVDFKSLEIIVVDDGSADGTSEFLKEVKAPCTLKYFIQPHKGKSASLNHGIKESSGRFILLMSDDLIADENLINEHLKMHEEYGEEDIAVLGYISAIPSDDTTPFMEFILRCPNTQYAPRIAYNFNDITCPDYLGPNYFYTTNISVKRDAFNKVGLFNEKLDYGMQDIEFGCRFSLNRYPINYNHKAVVHCLRSIGLEKFMSQQSSIGEQFTVLAYRHPDVWDINRFKKESIKYWFDKGNLIRLSQDVIRKLEEYPETTRSSYKFLGSSLLERCYFLLSNYFYGQGINEAVRKMEGDGWVQVFSKQIGIKSEYIINENRAYELLIESCLHSSKGDFLKSFDMVNSASDFVPEHPTLYYAAGALCLSSMDYKGAETAFERGLEIVKIYQQETALLMIGEAMYFIQLAMSCIPQGKYKKASESLERIIKERGPISIGHGVIIYKCLSLCYKALGNLKKSAFCRDESERLKDELKNNEISIKYEEKGRDVNNYR